MDDKRWVKERGKNGTWTKWRSRTLFLAFLLTASAALGLWSNSHLHSPFGRVIGLLLCLMAFGATCLALYQRLSERSCSVRALWRFALVSALIFALGLGAAGTGLAYTRALRIIKPARILPDSTPESVGIQDYLEVRFPSRDGLTLRGWYIPSRNGAVVIFVHGLGANRTAFWDEVSLLYPHGYGMLLFDLRNSGESEGEITTLGLLEADDVDSAVNFVLGQPDVEEDKIALLGRSMGGATVILSAARNPLVSAVIAQNAYASLEDNLSTGIRQLTGLPPFPFAPLVVFFGEREAGLELRAVRPVDVIHAISPRPILLMHGAQDDLIPVSNAYRLYEAAAPPKELFILESAGHGGFGQADPQGYAQRLLDFLHRSLFGAKR